MSNTPEKEDIDDDCEDANIFCRVTSRKSESRIYDAFISGKISLPFFYTKLITVLRGASEDDIVNIYINSGGGDMMTAFQIMGAIINCQGKVRIYLDGEVCSAASMIAIGAYNTEIFISPFASMMCHAYTQTGEEGKRHEIKASVDFFYKHLSKKIREIYDGFLTKVEINAMLNGRDYYFDANEISRRLKARGVKEYGHGIRWTKARRNTAAIAEG